MANTILERTVLRIQKSMDELQINWETGEVLNKKVHLDKDGYAFISLGGMPTHVHRIVGVYKYGMDCVGMQIDHIIPMLDGGSNGYFNIQLVTQKENNRKRKPFKVVKSKVKAINKLTGEITVHENQAECARELGLLIQSICKCLSPRHRQQSHRGYTFERVMD